MQLPDRSAAACGPGRCVCMPRAGLLQCSQHMVRTSNIRGLQAITLLLSDASAMLSYVGAANTALWPANRAASTSGAFSRALLRQRQQQRQRQHRSAQASLSSAAVSPPQTAGNDQQVAENDSVNRLRELVDSAGGRVVALTGAGMSTDSGIPDYRGPKGSYSRGHKPMTHDEFISSEANRKRYWARATFGWNSFSKAGPNTAHFALAALEEAGKVGGVITQNVDGLHQKSGSRNVVDLHGRMDKIECMCCGVEACRHEYQAQLATLNAPWMDKHAEALGMGDKPKSGGDPDVRLRADGDADVEPGERLKDFVVPECSECGGFLKPSVVFFGDNIPRPRVEETFRMVDDSSLLIAAGSSLHVYSAFRLVKRAADAGKSVAIINLGETRAERSGLDLLKVEAGVSSVLPLLL